MLVSDWTRRIATTVALFALGCQLLRGQAVVHASIPGMTSQSFYGYAVDGGRDVDGDGSADIVVGAAYESRAYVYSGRTMQPLYVLSGTAPDDEFGLTVALLDDLDGDGNAEIAVGAPYADGAVVDGGSVIVFSGASGAIMHSFDGHQTGARFGNDVACAGDVDGDGVADVVTGAPYHDVGAVIDVGAAFVFSGATGSQIGSLVGSGPANLFGWAVSGLDDVNGDGHDDVLVGSRWNDEHGPNAGKCTVVSVLDRVVLLSNWGEGGGDQFGAAVASVGDLDADGCADYVVGAFQNDHGGVPNPGRAYAFSGATGALIFVWTGTKPQDRLGFSVSGAGDVDGDGTPDVTVGAVLHSTAAPGAGRAYVFSGGDGSELFHVDGEGMLDFLGASVAPGGDVNGDGFAEIVAGAIGADASVADVGKIYVRSDPAIPTGPFIAQGCGAGTVDDGQGGTFDVFRVDLKAGGLLRRVDVPAGAPFRLEMHQPPAYSGPADHFLWVDAGLPSPGSAWPAPGLFCFPPPSFAGSSALILAAPFGLGLLPYAPTPWSAIAHQGLPFPAVLTFQGVVTDGVRLDITNALILRVQ